jgi:alginate O-acetyltransferase complex protein AlgI
MFAAVYGYAIVIYCDFSGYSSVAIGIARWLGYKIPPNFLSPYQSKDITEFWRRWHISLSSWLKDYLYIPLGGNRKGKLRTYINLFITMLLGGLWHGASFNFIIWGGLHGTALAIHKLWNEQAKKMNHKWQTLKLYKILEVLLTFHFVCFCWIFFKATNFHVATDMIKQIQHHFSWQVWAQFWGNYHNVIWMMLVGFALHAVPEKFSEKIIVKLYNLHVVSYAAIFLLFLLVYGYYKSSEAVMPIYLQF